MNNMFCYLTINYAYLVLDVNLLEFFYIWNFIHQINVLINYLLGTYCMHFGYLLNISWICINHILCTINYYAQLIINIWVS